jgi:DNA-binding transcriptional LysR family regulator
MAAFSRMRASMYDRMIAACQQGGLTPRIVAELSPSEARLTLVSLGLGICFVDDLLRGYEGPQIALRRVEDFSVPLSLSLVWRRANQSRLLRRFLDIAAADPATR